MLAIALCTLALDAPDEPSEYEKKQASKLDSANRKDLIQVWDQQIEMELARRLRSHVDLIHSPVLCVGARLGGEARAFRSLRPGLLALGVDFNPGPRNPHVLWGDAHALQFGNDTFNAMYVNVLDHILDTARFVDEARRVLRPSGTLFVDMDHNPVRSPPHQPRRGPPPQPTARLGGAAQPDNYSVHDLRAERPAMVALFRSRFQTINVSVVKGEKDSPKHAYIFRKREGRSRVTKAARRMAAA